MKEEEYAIYIKPLYENWTLEEAKERIRKAQEENEDILEEITKRIIDAEAENTKLKQDREELIGWLERELEKCHKDTVINRAKPNVRFWRMKDFREVLEKLGE